MKNRLQTRNVIVILSFGIVCGILIGANLPSMLLWIAVGCWLFYVGGLAIFALLARPTDSQLKANREAKAARKAFYDQLYQKIADDAATRETPPTSAVS